jgi:hypothetical protein
MNKKKVKIGSPTMKKKKKRKETKEWRASKKSLRKAMRKQKKIKNKKRNGMRMPINSKKGKRDLNWRKTQQMPKVKKKNQA